VKERKRYDYVGSLRLGGVGHRERAELVTRGPPPPAGAKSGKAPFGGKKITGKNKSRGVVCGGTGPAGRPKGPAHKEGDRVLQNASKQYMW